MSEGNGGSVWNEERLPWLEVHISPPCCDDYFKHLFFHSSQVEIQEADSQPPSWVAIINIRRQTSESFMIIQVELEFLTNFDKHT